MPEAIYRREGDLYLPTEWAGGPWSRNHQHGGPVNGLLASAVAGAAEETGLRPIRLTIDLLGPVPLKPLVLEWEFVRRGRRMAIVDARLAHEGRVVARASAILVEVKPDLEPSWTREEESPTTWEGLSEAGFIDEEARAFLPPGFHWSLRARKGPPGWVWLTTDLDLIAGAPTSPFLRAAMVSDLSFAVAGLHPPSEATASGERERMMLINTDSTLHFERWPLGSAFAFRHDLLADQAGSGLAHATLFDERGRYGQASQSLLRNPR